MNAKTFATIAALLVLTASQVVSAQTQRGADQYAPQPQNSDRHTTNADSAVAGEQVSPAPAPPPSPPRGPGRPRKLFMIPTPGPGAGGGGGGNNDPNLAPDPASATRACLQNCVASGLRFDTCYHSCVE